MMNYLWCGSWGQAGPVNQRQWGTMSRKSGVLGSPAAMPPTSAGFTWKMGGRG